MRDYESVQKRQAVATDASAKSQDLTVTPAPRHAVSWSNFRCAIVEMPRGAAQMPQVSVKHARKTITDPHHLSMPCMHGDEVGRWCHLQTEIPAKNRASQRISQQPASRLEAAVMMHSCICWHAILKQCSSSRYLCYWYKTSEGALCAPASSTAVARADCSAVCREKAQTTAIQEQHRGHRCLETNPETGQHDRSSKQACW